MYLNGVQQGVDTSGTVVSGFSEISLNGYGSAANNAENAKVSQALVFKTRLSNLDLAILTGATTYNTFAAMALALNYTVYE